MPGCHPKTESRFAVPTRLSSTADHAVAHWPSCFGEIQSFRRLDRIRRPTVSSRCKEKPCADEMFYDFEESTRIGRIPSDVFRLSTGMYSELLCALKYR